MKNKDKSKDKDDKPTTAIHQDKFKEIAEKVISGTKNSTYAIKKKYELWVHEGTVVDIMAEYQANNEAFVKAIERYNQIFSSRSVAYEDIIYLKSLHLDFRQRRVTEEEEKKLSVSIYRNILDATFEETFEKTKLFLGDDPDNWRSKTAHYRKLILQISVHYHRFLITKLENMITHLDYLFFTRAKFSTNFSYHFTSHLLFERSFKIKDLESRKKHIEYELRLATEFQTTPDLNKVVREEFDEFVNICNSWIKRIEDDIEKNKGKSSEDNQENDTITNKYSESPISEIDITARRQVLALFYLFEELNPDIWSNNKSATARFIQMLTGKNIDNIYNFVHNPFLEKKSKNVAHITKDTKLLSELFSDLGLDTIVRRIEEESLYE